MKKLALIFLALSFLVTSGTYLLVKKSVNTSKDASQRQPYIPPTKEVQKPTVEELHQLTNAERAKVGITPLVLEPRLNASAQAKAEDMKVNNYFEHTSPVTGVSGAKTAFDAMATCYTTSENILKNTTLNTSARVIQGFMNSATHRAAILDPKYTYIGYGVAGIYTVQHFCEQKPKSVVRVGAMCYDGYESTAIGSGACAGHGGVEYWLTN